jgi:hypothetical protein
VAHFSRKRFGWGPPKTWQGWVFLGIWSLAFTAVASQPPSVLGGLLSLGLLAFFLYVVSRDDASAE